MRLIQASLQQFFDELPGPIDHVLVTAGGPHYAPVLADGPRIRCARRSSDHVVLALAGRPKCRRQDATRRHAAADGRYRRPADQAANSGSSPPPPRRSRRSPPTLALELAPVRVNLIAAGFVDTPLSASLLGDGLDARRDELRATLPIGRVVRPADVAALAVHIMTNTALTGATYDIDGGQQFV